MNDNEDEDDPPVQNLDPGASEDVVMDNLDTLQDVCTMFYASAWCSKLVATLTLMNMCTIHGYFNKFVDEIFFILHNFLLPMDNCSSSSMHGAKTLTQHIGLKYKKNHACSSRLYCIKGSMQI